MFVQVAFDGVRWSKTQVLPGKKEDFHVHGQPFSEWHPGPALAAENSVVPAMFPIPEVVPEDTSPAIAAFGL